MTLHGARFGALVGAYRKLRGHRALCGLQAPAQPKEALLQDALKGLASPWMVYLRILYIYIYVKIYIYICICIYSMV